MQAEGEGLMRLPLSGGLEAAPHERAARKAREESVKESPESEVARIFATWPEADRLAGVLRVVRAMGEEREQLLTLAVDFFQADPEKWGAFADAVHSRSRK